MNPVYFEALGLSEPIQRALRERGYTSASPIQAQAIPALLEGHDFIGCAQTGTGKTAAFALPVLAQLSQRHKSMRRGEVRTLILAPTRELALQVQQCFEHYGKYLSVRSIAVYGGMPMRPQIQALRKGVEVLIATPGRLMDLRERGHVSFDRVEFLVLDEVDRMLDMGFIRDVQTICRELPENRQSILFSATLESSLEKLAQTIVKNPVRVTINPEKPVVDKISQSVFYSPRDSRMSLLERVLKNSEEGLSLVFSRTKRGAEKVARNLKRVGIDAESMHGDKSQSARQHALERFRRGSTRVLVATDVAARGIDIKCIQLVVNYDLPESAETYVHRIGRTGRAGASGHAVSFCDTDDLKQLSAIERYTGHVLTVNEEHPFPAGARQSLSKPRGRFQSARNYNRQGFSGKSEQGGQRPNSKFSGKRFNRSRSKNRSASNI